MFPKIFLKQFWKDTTICANKLSDHLVLGFIVAALDAFLIALISFLYSFFSRRIMQNAVMIFAQSYGHIESITPEAMLEFTSSSLGQSTIFIESVKNGALFLFVGYFAWSIIQTFSWHITYRITESKHGPKLLNYMRRFFIINLIWLLPMYIIMIIYFYLSTGSNLIMGDYAYLFYLVILLIAIPMHISYTMIFEKKKMGNYVLDFLKILKLENIAQILFVFLSASILYYISDIIQAALIHSPGAMLFIGFILVFGIIILTRLMLIRIVYRILKNKKK